MEEPREPPEEPSSSLYQERIAICKRCEHLLAYRFFNQTVYQCGVCFCLLQLKAPLRFMHCDIGKW